jgi:hypothetical protein
VNDGKHVDLFRFDVIDDAIGTFDDFANLIEVVFGNPATREGVLGNLSGTSSQTIDHPSRILC